MSLSRSGAVGGGLEHSPLAAQIGSAWPQSAAGEHPSPASAEYFAETLPQFIWPDGLQHAGLDGSCRKSAAKHGALGQTRLGFST
jgi:hypothetical protein